MCSQFRGLSYTIEKWPEKRTVSKRELRVPIKGVVNIPSLIILGEEPD